MADTDKRLSAAFRPTSIPEWFQSAQLGIGETGDSTVLWSVPQAAGTIVVHDAFCHISVPLAGGTPSIDVGTGTMLFDSLGAIVVVNDDNIIDTVDINEVVVDWYQSAVLGNGKILVGADATVPVIYQTVAGSLTAGAWRVYILASRVG